jgi:hypothetical protein
VADHDDEVSMADADVDEVTVADRRRAHVPRVPCNRVTHTTLGMHSMRQTDLTSTDKPVLLAVDRLMLACLHDTVCSQPTYVISPIGTGCNAADRTALYTRASRGCTFAEAID